MGLHPMKLKSLLTAASPLLCARLAADDIVVVAKDDCRTIGPGDQVAPQDSANAAFLTAAKRPSGASAV